MADTDVSGALRGAFAARGEIADRADRCRAMLGDILGSDVPKHRRELALLVAAVEERIPEALRGATTLADVESIAARFREDRALEPTAARWTVDVWSDALRSVGVTSIPTTVISEPAEVSDVRAPIHEEMEDDVPATMLSVVGPGVDVVANGEAPETERELATLRESLAEHARSQPPEHLASLSDVSEAPPSRRSRRGILLGAIAFTIAAAIGVGAVLAFNGGSNDKKPETPPPPATEVVIRFPRVNAGARTTLARTWTFAGDQGSILKGELVFTMAKGANPTIDEVFPESLAKSSKAVKLSYAKSEFTRVAWVKRDPVLRIVPKPRAGTARLTYEVKVAPKGAAQARLAKWQKDATLERAAWIKERTSPAAFDITSPPYDTRLQVSPARFLGTTAPGNNVRLAGVSTTLEGAFVGARDLTVDKKGAWTTDVALAPGPNFVKFEATSPNGTPQSKIWVVYYEAPSSGGGSPGPGRGSPDPGPSPIPGPSPSPTPLPASPPPTPPPTAHPPTTPSTRVNPGPPVAGDDSFSGYWGDSDTIYSSGYAWWKLVVGKNDNGHTAIRISTVTTPRYGFAQEEPNLCGGYLCIWYRLPCDGTYTDTFSYSIYDEQGGTATAKVTVRVSYSNDGNAANDC